MRILAQLIIAILLSFQFSCLNDNSSEQDLNKANKEIIELPLQEPVASVITLQQVNRETITQNILVPDNEVYTDIFKQAEALPPVIDILLVIDNSYSMEEEQISLADKLNALISDLSEVDWQINVITTDSPCSTTAELPLTPETPDMNNLFKNAVKVGINGSGYEKGLKFAADNVLQGCSSNPAWLRPNSALAILVVSDEDEDSTSRYRENAPLFLNDLGQAGYITGENFKFYGIIGHPSSPCPTIQSPGELYATVIEATGGIWGSICAPDYGPTLSAISEDIRLNLKREFPLRFKPVLSTLDLTLNGAAYIGAWTLVGQKIILADSLPENSTLEITYQVESFRLIQLGVDPKKYLLESLSIDGQWIPPSEYNYDKLANFVLLMFDPESGAKIESTLVSQTELITVFPFPNVEPSKIACYVDERLWPASYTIDRQSIEILPPIPAGAEAHCLYNI
jgi:hypothetical protein